MERIKAHRLFFASLITAKAGLPPGSDLAAAFAAVPRERFVSEPPWKIFTPAGYIETPSDDPAFLYQDVVVALGSDEPLNNGEPTLHALCLSTLTPQKGEKIVHVGAGTGYYTAVLAKLVGESGTIDAYEINASLAQRAVENLTDIANVKVHSRTGSEAPLPPCDVLYVNAGATAPLAIWLDSLTVGGRLLFPLTPDKGIGAMLLITKREEASYGAKFLFQAQFVPCLGARNQAEEQNLAKAFHDDSWRKVKSLHRDDRPGDNCWLCGSGWWLSTE